VSVVRTSARRRAAQLLAATGLAVALPLFDALADDPAFFAARGSPALDIVLFSLAVVLLPPAILLALELVAGAYRAHAAVRLHAGLVGLLAGLFSLWGLERLGLESTVVLVTASLVAGALAGLAIARARPAGTLLAFLAPAPLVLLGLFLFASPVAELTLPTDTDVDVGVARSSTPVVVVVLGELPTVSLLDETGELDAGRFPAFAALAGSSTWFRNASTVSASTAEAVPALLSGKLPEPDRLPIAQNHPQTLFTLLGAEYRMNVRETQARLCPRELCERQGDPGGTGLRSLLSDGSAVYLRVAAPPDLEDELPAPDPERASFGDGGTFDASRERGFRAFLRSLHFEEGGDPSLDLIHLRLPQSPWTRFPNGSESVVPGERARAGDEAATLQAWQRHLLQAGYADRLLGLLVERLREVGLWERALVAVVTDHGIAFRADEDPLAVNADTLPELAFVPFFLKLPGQSSGRVEDLHVTSVDVLPTIADALGVPVPWETDGASGLDVRRGARQVRVDGVSAPLGAALGGRQAALVRRVELLGAGAWDAELYGAGPYANLVGRTLGEVSAGADAEGEAVLAREVSELLGSLPPRPPLVPTPVTGRVTGTAGPGDVLAVAVNGVVEAVCAVSGEEGAARFSALVPPEAFVRGANEVRVFVVGGSPASPSLAELEMRAG